MTRRYDLLWVVYDNYTPQTTGSSLKMIKLHDFPDLVNCWWYKVDWLLKMTRRMCSVTSVHLRQPAKTPFFEGGRGLFNEISKIFISRELYIIKLDDLTDWKTHLSNRVQGLRQYIHQGPKENGLRKRISEFLSKLNSL